jgi:hypothetical protein
LASVLICCLACSSKSRPHNQAPEKQPPASLHADCSARECALGQECLRYPLDAPEGGERSTCEIKCTGPGSCPTSMECRPLGRDRMMVCYYERETEPAPRKIERKVDPLVASMGRQQALDLLRALEQLARRDSLSIAPLVALCENTPSCASPLCRERLAACEEEPCKLEILADVCPSIDADSDRDLAAFLVRRLRAGSARARAFLDPQEAARLAKARQTLELSRQ